MHKKWQKGFTGFLAACVFSTTLLGANPVMAESTQFHYSSGGSFQRLGGTDRYETAAKISQEGWSDHSSEYAILSAGMDENLVDSLTAAPLAHLKNAPILLTEGDKLNPYTEQELGRLGVKTVYITSGVGVITQPVRDKLEKDLGLTVISLGGQDRFETSINIAKQLGDFNRIVISTAWSNADALSVASIAASQKMPILLSDAQALTPTVIEYLNSLPSEIQQTYVLGGEGVLSKTVEEALPNPQRLAGLDRYYTNIRILLTFLPKLQGEKVYVASGNDANLVDALAGSSLAAQSGSGIVLVSGQNSIDNEGAIQFVKHNMFPISREDFVALGGEAIVPSSIIVKMSAVEEYIQDGETIGLEWLMKSILDNIVVTGDNVSLNHLDAWHNVYIEGNNVSLDTVNVSGAIIINPGPEGKVSLSNLHATNILVVSGAPNEIILNNVEADFLMFINDTATGVKTLGSTSIEETLARGQTTLNAEEGSFGQVLVAKLTPDDIEPHVQLKGVFVQPVLVSEGVITNLDEIALPALGIVTQTQDQKVTLNGFYDEVKVLTPATVEIKSLAVINKLITNNETNLIISEGAVVKEIVKE